MVLASPSEGITRVTLRTLVVYGENSFPPVVRASIALGETLPNAQLHMLPGQTHDLAADALAPVLREFYLH
ncbi:MAG: hypothetical protein M3Y26_08490 [Actinomycetota bacterium]|nr:hypothetical protein [Actinomycetota bacterium]